MRIQQQQVWEIRRGDYPDDPIVQRVTDVDHPWIYTVSYLKSSPNTVISRGWCHRNDLIGTGVLVRGPGAISNRAEVVIRARDLLAYSAQRDPKPHRDGVAVLRAPLIEVLAEELGDSERAALVLREAVGQLGGAEGHTWGGHDSWDRIRHKSLPCYVLPKKS